MASKTIEKLKKEMEHERYYHIAAIASAEERIENHKNRLREIDDFITAIEEERE